MRLLVSRDAVSLAAAYMNTFVVLWSHKPGCQEGNPPDPGRSGLVLLQFGLIRRAVGPACRPPNREPRRPRIPIDWQGVARGRPRIRRT